MRDREEQDREKQERVRKAEQYKVREREEEQEMRQLLASVKQEMAKMNDVQKAQEKRKESEKEKEKERDSEKEREKEKEKEERGTEREREKRIESATSRVLIAAARNEEQREDERVMDETPSNEEGPNQSQIKQVGTNNDNERWEELAQQIELLIRQEFDARENKRMRR